MASFPSSKVHRPSRRKLGRGQHAQVPPVACTPTFSTTTITLTFATPVIVSGTIPLTVLGGSTFVSQAVSSPTVVTQTWSSSFSTTVTAAMANNPANVVGAAGGQVVGFAAVG